MYCAAARRHTVIVVKHVIRVVQFNTFALILELHALMQVARSYALLVALIVILHTSQLLGTNLLRHAYSSTV